MPINVRFVCASAIFGVVRPACGSRPVYAEICRRPPGRMRSPHRRSARRAHPTACGRRRTDRPAVHRRRPRRDRSAPRRHLIEFVITVIDGRWRSRRANSVVVVPALIAIVIPSSTVSAATAAIAAFSARCWAAFTDDHGSSPRLCRVHRAAVHLAQQVLGIQRIEVAPHGHLRDVEFGGQIGDPDGSAGVQRPQIACDVRRRAWRPSEIPADQLAPKTHNIKQILLRFGRFAGYMAVSFWCFCSNLFLRCRS